MFTKSGVPSTLLRLPLCLSMKSQRFEGRDQQKHGLILRGNMLVALPNSEKYYSLKVSDCLKFCETV